MSDSDLEEKRRLIQRLFEIGRGTIQATRDELFELIHHLGTLRKRLGERT